MYESNPVGFSRSTSETYTWIPQHLTLWEIDVLGVGNGVLSNWRQSQNVSLPHRTAWLRICHPIRT